MRRKFLFLCTFVSVLGFLMSCSDDKKKPDIPPVLEDVIGEYASDKLSVKVDGKDADANAKIHVLKEADNTVSLKLTNIVPGVEEFIIPNAQFNTASRSSYVATLSGKHADNVSGYEVSVDGTVDNDVLTAIVSIKEIAGESVEPEQFIGARYKGEMKITAGNLPAPVTIEQQVYITKTETEEPNVFCLNIDNFGLGEDLQLGDIKLDGVTLVKRGDVYGFSAEGCKIDLDIVGEVTLDVKGAINGSTMTMNLDIDALGMKVTVAFTGEYYFGFDMTQWVNVTSGKYTYQEPLFMATSNQAGVFLMSMIDSFFVVYDEDEGAAKIDTKDTEGKNMIVTVVPKATAGTMFTGSFVLNATNTLKSTHFGVPYRMKPTTLKVTYKYTAGEKFYETTSTGSGLSTKVTVTEFPDIVDKCSIAAYLFEVDSYDDYLDGNTIKDSDSKIIMVASLTSEGEANFTSEELKFEEIGKGTYDPNKKYKLAIVCTSSSEGDAYRGAPGSTLWVKNLEVLGE